MPATGVGTIVDLNTGALESISDSVTFCEVLAQPRLGAGLHEYLNEWSYQLDRILHSDLGDLGEFDDVSARRVIVSLDEFGQDGVGRGQGISFHDRRSK